MYIRDRGKPLPATPPPPSPFNPQLACQVLNLEPQACVRCGSICDYTYKASGGASGLRVVLESRRQALGHTCWCQRLYRLVLLLRNDSTLYKEINSGVGGNQQRNINLLKQGSFGERLIRSAPLRSDQTRAENNTETSSNTRSSNHSARD